MRTTILTLSSFSLGLISSLSFAQNIKPIVFEKDQWEMYCSNIGTCRAAGYQIEDDQLPASILITRKAGANQGISVEYTLSDQDQELRYTAKDPIRFYLNGKDLGMIQPVSGDFSITGQLNKVQTQALSALLKQKVRIEFKNKKYHWIVSDAGMTATLLKMDDFQKRVGTTNALIRKGSQNESALLQPAPKLEVKKVKTSDKPYLTLKPSTAQYKTLFSTLMAAKPKVKDPDEDICQGSFEGEKEGYRFGNIELYKLTNNKILATTLCWSGAYNQGYGAWVVDQSLKGKAEFVSESVSDVLSGELVAAHKGRGVGDCWSHQQWIWNGARFIQTSDRWSGACKGVTGGMWSLEKIESDIR
ncbi:DUF1176 domain-containing protein [Acinetobacter shaoyimingii]|uniref:DUF1176 domain-containing protein n=1 Tax=Acinetobacter shaoyimingii TaxID=2715164 RepID=A0A6G8RXP9_9GAMM|nr:DUF1176 domain-containing protein [Acinetobacter shaoyimingii]QIO06645.1 DUF1176 domain-containing protein [Acinetobacter shaoyimingii]